MREDQRMEQRAFPAQIVMTDAQTGETRTLDHDEYEFRELGETEFFWGRSSWEDGNYSCDCNRALFFYFADSDGLRWPCTDGRFRVESIVDLRNGEKIYSDSERGS